MDTVRINNRIYSINGYKKVYKGSGKRSKWVNDKSVLMLKRIKDLVDGVWITVDYEPIQFKLVQFEILLRFGYSRVILCLNEEKPIEPLEKIF